MLFQKKVRICFYVNGCKSWGRGSTGNWIKTKLCKNVLGFITSYCCSSALCSCPPPGDLPNPGIEPRSPALQVGSLSSEPPGKPKCFSRFSQPSEALSAAASVGVLCLTAPWLPSISLCTVLLTPRCMCLKLLLLFSRWVVSNSLQPMDYSTPGFPVLHHFLELSQTHVHWVGDAIHFPQT